jgi:hypothetical protein
MALELCSVWIPSSSFNLHYVVNTESNLCADRSTLFKTVLDVIGVLTFNELSCTFQRLCATAVNDTSLVTDQISIQFHTHQAVKDDIPLNERHADKNAIQFSRNLPYTKNMGAATCPI